MNEKEKQLANVIENGKQCVNVCDKEELVSVKEKENHLSKIKESETFSADEIEKQFTSINNKDESYLNEEKKKECEQNKPENNLGKITSQTQGIKNKTEEDNELSNLDLSQDINDLAETAATDVTDSGIVVNSRNTVDSRNKFNSKKEDSYHILSTGKIKNFPMLKTTINKCNNCNKNKETWDFNQNSIPSDLHTYCGTPADEIEAEVIKTVESIFKKCQDTEKYVPVKEKLVLFESLSRLGRVRSTEDVSLKQQIVTKRARSLHDLSYSVPMAGVREMCKYFENKTEEPTKSMSFEKKQISRRVFIRNMQNVSFA